ncbi:MAG TPA: cytochrome P450 [Ilumatobacteraceae bacterium]|nr:cytochrome P450 [Ilumatobacteraceae bacterium]
MTVVTPAEIGLGSFDLSDPEFWLASREVREGAFQTLRREQPVSWWDEWEFEDMQFPRGPGYWSVVNHQDVWQVSRNPQLFCSGQGVNVGDMPIEIAEFFGSMINMDDPRHFRLRNIVSKGFTPKEITRVEEYVKDKATLVVDRMLERFPDRECDFVHEIAAPLPLQIICEMMGIPESDEEQIFNWTNVVLGIGDPEFASTFEELVAAGMGLFQYAQALGEDRLANPREDLTSIMMHAEVDGERLTAQEFGSFFILLVVAGNETTRNAISHGMHLLTEHPDQRALWWDNWDANTKTAVDEIVRYATPVIHFRRTATADTELGGQQIKAGQKLVMWYNSANRDDRVFDDPFRFDVTRPLLPNQVGFGAGGPHFCLGANLARREIAVMFDEIRRRVPTLRTVGEPDYLQSNFINGVKRLRCTW